MKKIILFAILCFWLFSLSAGAIGGPPIEYSEAVTFPGCEFRVYFPTKTQRKTAYANGIESVMVQSVYDGKSPFMRVECLPLADPGQTTAAFRSVLENQARMSGIQDPEITIETINLGIVGTYSGLRKAGGFDIKFFGKLIIGDRSLLSLLISEELSQFPSDKTVYFLNTVEKISVADAGESPRDVYQVASTLGGSGAKLAKTVQQLEEAIEHITDTKNRGLIYIAAKEIEHISLTIILQGELLGASQLIRDQEKQSYYPHLIDVLNKGNRSIREKLKTVEEARAVLPHGNFTASLDSSITIIKEALVLLERGMRALQVAGK